jgi:hypothetical protein
MFVASRVLPVRTAVLRVASISTASGRVAAHEPNTPLDLDPSLQTLLRDVDASIARHKARGAVGGPRHRELEVSQEEISEGLDWEEDTDGDFFGRESRKSPAALFGSSRHGAVVLPLELQNSITSLIESESRLVIVSNKLIDPATFQAPTNISCTKTLSVFSPTKGRMASPPLGISRMTRSIGP